jgi:hypothetical protein
MTLDDQREMRRSATHQTSLSGHIWGRDVHAALDARRGGRLRLRRRIRDEDALRPDTGQMYVKSLIAALSLSLLPMPAAAQPVGQPLIVNGRCGPQSGVTIDEGEISQFSCDVAVLARMQNGTVLIQFTDRSGDDGRILGFAGTIEGRQAFGADSVQMLGVERLYLAGGAEPVPVTRGSCIMNWSGLQRTGGRLTSVVCGARGMAEGSDVQAMVVLDAQ